MRRFQIMIATLCALALTACTGAGASPEATDKAFLDDLQSGWTARWDFFKAPEQELKFDDPDYAVKYKQQLSSAIALELDRISSYPPREFADSELRSRALTYVDLLSESREALQYLNVDPPRFDKLWSDVYDRRTIAILDFIDNYEIQIPETHAEIVDEMRTNARLASEIASFTTSLNSIFCEIEWVPVEESYGWHTFEARVTNTTGIDIKHVSASLAILDSTNVNVGTSYASVDNWREGQTAILDFSTDSEVSDLDIGVSWDLPDGRWGQLVPSCGD